MPGDGAVLIDDSGAPGLPFSTRTQRAVILPASFLDLAELEHHATSLHMISIVHIPGLFQTPDYARTMFSYAVPELSSDALESRVEHRMRRRMVLEHDEPTPFVSVIHEAALRIVVSDRRTARKQLERVAELSTAANVEVRVIPFDAERFAGAGYSMLHAGGPTPQLDTIQIDHAASSGFLHAEAQLNKYRHTFEKVAGSSLSPTDSRDFIHHLIKRE